MLATLEPSGTPTTSLWYSSGTTTPYVGGIGSPEMIMKAGIRNVEAASSTITQLAGHPVIVYSAAVSA